MDEVNNGLSMEYPKKGIHYRRKVSKLSNKCEISPLLTKVLSRGIEKIILRSFRPFHG